MAAADASLQRTYALPSQGQPGIFPVPLPPYQTGSSGSPVSVDEVDTLSRTRTSSAAAAAPVDTSDEDPLHFTVDSDHCSAALTTIIQDLEHAYNTANQSHTCQSVCDYIGYILEQAIDLHEAIHPEAPASKRQRQHA